VVGDLEPPSGEIVVEMSGWVGFPPPHSPPPENVEPAAEDIGIVSDR
jgi:hypothetical protein